MKILYEDKDQIVIHKPAGVATQTARLGEKDLVSEVKNHIAKATGAANPYVGVINRLDQPVEGIVLFAKNAKSAAELSKQMQDGSMQKYYMAAVFGQLPKEEDTLTDYLEKDEISALEGAGVTLIAQAVQAEGFADADAAFDAAGYPAGWDPASMNP